MTDRRDQHSVTGVLPAIEPVDCMVPFWRALPESSCADRPVTTLNLASGDTSIIMVKGLVVTAPCDWPGEDGLVVRPEPILASEDFAFFLEKVPGCYVFLGNGVGSEGGCMVHNPGYDFNDACLSTGASYWVKLAEAYLHKAK